MAISNFIPNVWSETLYSELDRQYIAVANTNREFEGDIKEKGSSVKICGIGYIAVSDYTKDTDMSNPQTLSDMAKELVIDQAKYFNFQIDDIDKAQGSPKLMEAAMRKAASALANEADRHVLTMCKYAGHIMRYTPTVDNIIDIIIAARTRLLNANVSSSEEVVLEVSPSVAELIVKAKINNLSDNCQTLENGCIGSIFGCKIFVTNNIMIDDESGMEEIHKCMMRTKRSVAFAEQLSEIHAYRPEKRFADALKGLYLYGAKVVYPSELLSLDLIMPIT